MATDYLSQALSTGAPSSSTLNIDTAQAHELWNQINDWLAGLPATRRTTVLQAINRWNSQQRLSNPLYNVAGISHSDLTNLAGTLQNSYGTATAPVPGASVAPQPTPLTGQEQKQNAADALQGNAVTAATATTAQLPDTTSMAETGYGIPVVGAAGATIPGTTQPSGFNNLLENYYASEFAQAGTDPVKLAEIAGMDPNLLQQQYSEFTRGWAKAQQSGIRPGFVGGAGINMGQAPMSISDFAQQKAQATIGPWAAILDAISGIYQSQFRQALPADLAMQIVTALNGMPQSQQSNVLYNVYQYMTNKANAIANKGLFDQTGSYAAAVLGSLPSSILTYTGGSGTGTGSLGTSGIVGTYAQLHPSSFLQGETISTEIANDFQQKLNRAPTAADMAALGSAPTPQQITAYIDNQPVAGTGMKYGAYSEAVSSLTPDWQRYFGRDPTTHELQWSIGQTPQDIQNFIYNSPSKVSGLTIGKYQDYSNEIQNVQGDLPVSASDDFMSSLHQAVTKK